MNDSIRILIIEDDADINQVITSYLGKQGFSCTQAFSGSEARLLLGQVASDQKPDYDLVITDLMLPGMTGQELVAYIRSTTSVPIIVISALGDSAGKVELFGLGADDYLVKPFDLNELLARVMVQLRHVNRSAAEITDTLSFKDWVVDREARVLRVAGEPVRFTRTEYNIIEALVQRPKKVFTKQELYEAAWQEDCFIEEKAVNVHMSNIRSKLKPSGTDHYIETVWGIGFKLAEN